MARPPLAAGGGSRAARVPARLPAAVALACLLVVWLYLSIRPHAAGAVDGAAGVVAIGGGSRAADAGGGAQQREQRRAVSVTVFVGVMTGFTTSREARYDYEARRQALRETWFPATEQAAMRLQQEASVAMRFVVGHSRDAAAEQALAQEEQRHGGFVRLDIQEGYGGLPRKVLAFIRAALAGWQFSYLLKADDDVYVRPERLPHAAHQWTAARADYLGCMKRGPVFKDKGQRWFEPQHALLGDSYFTHAWGSSYVLSAAAARVVAALPPGLLRFLSNEDVTVGAWMLALNMTHVDDRRMCEPGCSASSIVVYDFPTCAGLCDPPASLQALHASAECKQPAVDASTGRLPTAKRAFRFAPTPQLDAA